MEAKIKRPVEAVRHGSGGSFNKVRAVGTWPVGERPVDGDGKILSWGQHQDVTDIGKSNEAVRRCSRPPASRNMKIEVYLCLGGCRLRS